MDRTAQRAEIKGRRGDEFVKKAEAGQQHASRTSKRQDEMKSNRCPSPPLLETLFSSPFASPSSFLYPLSFLGLDFLLPLSAPSFFFFIFPSFLPSLYSLRILHIRFNPRLHLPLSICFFFLFLDPFLLPRSYYLLFPLPVSVRSARLQVLSKEQAGGKHGDKERQNRGRGHANPLHAAEVNGRCTEPTNTVSLSQFLDRPARALPLRGVKRNF